MIVEAIRIIIYFPFPSLSLAFTLCALCFNRVDSRFMISSISSDSSSRTFPLYFACLPTTISITFSLGSLSCHMKHKTDDVIAQNLSILKIRFRHHYDGCVVREHLNLNPSELIWITLFSLSLLVCRLSPSRLHDFTFSRYFNLSFDFAVLPPRRRWRWCVRKWAKKIMFHVCEKKCEETLSNLKLGLIVEMSKESELRRISKYPRDMCNTPHCSLVWQKRGCTAYYIEFSVC